MDESTKAELVAAANLLIRSGEARDHYEMLVAAAPLVARYPLLRFRGDAYPLNALATVKVGEPDVYRQIIDLVERKREEADLGPLVESEESRFDKSAYMQQFMEQKRQRQRRAAEIENMQRHERDKLVGRARLDFMQRQSEIWKKERDALMDKAREAAKPQRLTRDEIQIIVNQFWAKVDRQLDELEAKVTAKGVIKNAASVADLDAVLRHDPYKKK
jgi:hypothetical protein